MIYIVDIDGTIADTPEGDEYDKAEPDMNLIILINSFYDRGDKIIIETGRGGITGKDWKKLTEEQLKEWGVKYHELRFVQKPAKYLRIDDMCCSPEELWSKT